MQEQIHDGSHKFCVIHKVVTLVTTSSFICPPVLRRLAIISRGACKWRMVFAYKWGY